MSSELDPIELDEPLYRRLRFRDVRGSEVMFGAVDMPASSCNRAKYSAPEGVLRSDRPEYNGVGTIMREQLPGNFCVLSNEEEYHFYAEYLPEEDNLAHTEIRLSITGEEFKKNPNRTARDKAREMLAANFEIHTAPMPTAPELSNGGDG